MITITRALPVPRRASFRAYGRDYGMLAVLALLIIVLEALDPTTLELANVRNLARQISITAMFAAGETLVILARQIDLSVGSTLGLAGVVSAGTLQRTDSVAAAIAVGLGVGAAVGLLNGLLVAKARLASFVVTLATLSIAAGLTLVYTGAAPIAVDNSTYLFIGEGAVAGVPMPIVLTVALYAALWFVQRPVVLPIDRHRRGRDHRDLSRPAVPWQRVRLSLNA